jgi:long-chain acyl-CoA synthetase
MVPAAVSDSTFPWGISGLLTDQVKSQPMSPAIFFGEEVINYGELGQRVRTLVMSLHDAGIRYGDKVGVFFPNHPDFIASFFAVVQAGATVVPINPLLKADEIAHILSDSEAKGVIVHEQLCAELEASLPRLSELDVIFTLSYKGDRKIESTSGKYVVALDRQAFSTVESEATNAARQIADHGVRISQDHLAVLVYTSGTTGKPKGAMLTHGNLVAAIEMKRAILDFTSSDRILAVLPLCHIYGLTVVMLGMVSQGGGMVIVEKFDPVAVLNTIQNRRVTVIPAVPAMYQFLSLELEKNSYDLSSLRYGLCGAAPLEAELLTRLDDQLGVPVLEGYALTETTCIATLTPLNGPRKFGSVGPKVPGIQLMVVDANLRPMQPGRENIGQVAIKGPNVMQGYYNQPDASAECLKQGLFLTGDLGYFDEDGYLYISGRTKEMIIRGGQNVYPREVEAAIMRLDNVLEVAVIGVPDRFMGERVKAVVVPRPGSRLTEDEVKEFCAQVLAPYKVPKIVELRDALPRNSTGKVLKRLLV